MWNSIKLLMATVSLALPLSGCGNEFTLEPTDVRVENRIRSSHDSKIHVCPNVSASGLLSRYWSEELPLVGYDHIWDWKPRKRCENGASNTFQSLFRFDLAFMPRDRELKSAKLYMTVLDPNQYPSLADDPERHEHTEFCSGTTGGIIGSVGITLFDWEPGKEIVKNHTPVLLAWNHDHGTMDITPLVHNWLTGALPNNGIVVRGIDYSKHKRNMVCAAQLTNVKLELVFEEE